jgi:hypothetical protein
MSRLGGQSCFPPLLLRCCSGRGRVSPILFSSAAPPLLLRCCSGRGPCFRPHPGGIDSLEDDGTGKRELTYSATNCISRPRTSAREVDRVHNPGLTDSLNELWPVFNDLSGAILLRQRVSLP